VFVPTPIALRLPPCVVVLVSVVVALGLASLCLPVVRFGRHPFGVICSLGFMALFACSVQAVAFLAHAAGLVPGKVPVLARLGMEEERGPQLLGVGTGQG